MVSVWSPLVTTRVSPTLRTVVDDEGRVHHLALVKGPGADAVLGGLKDAVAAVLAAAHDEVDHHALGASADLPSMMPRPG